MNAPSVGRNTGMAQLVRWAGHPPEVLQGMLDHLAELKRQGVEAINE